MSAFDGVTSSSTPLVRAANTSALGNGKRTVGMADLSFPQGQQIKVRKLYEVGESVTLPMNQLNAELICCVCQGVLRDPVYVKECMHRFCKVCITTWLSSHNNCPKCSTVVPSRRSCISDTRLQGLVSVFYPDINRREQQEASETKMVISRLAEQGIAKQLELGSAVQKTHSKHVTQAKRLQNPVKKRVVRSKQRSDTDDATHSSSSSSSSESESSSRSPSPSSRTRTASRAYDQQQYLPPLPPGHIGFWLRAHPASSGARNLQLERSYLRAQTGMTVLTLSEYVLSKTSGRGGDASKNNSTSKVSFALQRRQGSQTGRRMRGHAQGGGEEETLANDMNLEEVNTRATALNAPLELYYSIA